MWGAGDTTLLPVLVEQVRAGKLAWIGGGRHLTSTTHVDNTVEGLVLGAPSAARPGRPTSSPTARPSSSASSSRAARTQGVEPPDALDPDRPSPELLMEAGERAWSLLPLPGEPPLPRFAFWIASQECTLIDARAREHLGYAPV